MRMVLGPGLMYPVETVFTTVGCFAFMLAISPRLTLVALAVMPVVSILMKILGEKIFRRSEVVQAKMADISAVVQENAAAARLVRAFVQEDAQRKVFGKENEGLRGPEHGARRGERGALPAAAGPSSGWASRGRWCSGDAMVIGGGDLPRRAGGLPLLLRLPHLADDRHRLGGEHPPARRRLHEAPGGDLRRRAASRPAGRPGAGLRGPSRRGHRVPGTSASPTPSAAPNGAAGSNGAEPRAGAVGLQPAHRAGQTVAFVGRTGSGKSTVARLIPRI